MELPFPFLPGRALNDLYCWETLYPQRRLEVYEGGAAAITTFGKPSIHSVIGIQPLSVWDSFEDLIQGLEYLLCSFCTDCGACRTVSHFSLLSPSCCCTAVFPVLKSAAGSCWNSWSWLFSQSPLCSLPSTQTWSYKINTAIL